MRFIKWLLSLLPERKRKCRFCREILQEDDLDYCGECIAWNSMDLGSD